MSGGWLAIQDLVEQIVAAEEIKDNLKCEVSELTGRLKEAQHELVEQETPLLGLRVRVAELVEGPTK